MVIGERSAAMKDVIIDRLPIMFGKPSCIFVLHVMILRIIHGVAHFISHCYNHQCLFTLIRKTPIRSSNAGYTCRILPGNGCCSLLCIISTGCLKLLVRIDIWVPMILPITMCSVFFNIRVFCYLDFPVRTIDGTAFMMWSQFTIADPPQGVASQIDFNGPIRRIIGDGIDSCL